MSKKYYSFFTFLSLPHTPCTKTALSLPWHLTLFTISRPGTHTTLHWEDRMREWPTYTNMQSCSVMLHAHTHTAVCSRYINTLRATTAVLKKLGLDVPQQPLLLPLWEWFRSDSPSEVIILCGENSQLQGGLWKAGCGSVYIFENTYWTLLWLCPFLPVESLLCPLN